MRHLFALLLAFCMSYSAFGRPFTGGSMRDQKELPRLVRNGSDAERKEAIRVCGARRYHFCIRAMIDNLEDGDKEIRKISARYIGVLGQSIAVQPMQDAIERETDIDTKGAMILALGHLRNPKSAKFIEKFLSAKEEVIRRLAAHALGYTNNRKSLPPLKEKLGSEEVERNKVDYLKSILMIERSHKYMTQLFALLKSRDDMVRMQTAEALYDLALYEAVQPLERALELEDDETVRGLMHKAFVRSMYYDF